MDERSIQLLALVVAETIVAVVWLAVLAVSIVLVNRHVRRVAPPESRMESWGWAVGFASFCFWPAAIALGAMYLRDPKTVRVGRACVIGGLLNFTSAVVIAEILTAVLYIRFPEYIPR